MVFNFSFNEPLHDSPNTFRARHSLTYRSLLLDSVFKPGEVLGKLSAIISVEVVLLFVLFLFFDHVSVRAVSCMAALAIVALKGN